MFAPVVRLLTVTPASAMLLKSMAPSPLSSTSIASTLESSTGSVLPNPPEVSITTEFAVMSGVAPPSDTASLSVPPTESVTVLPGASTSPNNVAPAVFTVISPEEVSMSIRVIPSASSICKTPAALVLASRLATSVSRVMAPAASAVKPLPTNPVPTSVIVPALSMSISPAVTKLVTDDAAFSYRVIFAA